MYEPLCLVTDRQGDLWVGVADAVNSGPGEAVYVGVALDVPYSCPLPMGQYNGLAGIGLHDEFPFKFNYFL